jgi:hypothetical protein
MPKVKQEVQVRYYDWDFDGEEREPIYVSSERAANGSKVAVLENVQVNDGSKITVKIAPIMVSDSAFLQSLGDSGHESNIALIAHLCCGWGDKDFVMAEDIEAEVDAVADVAGVLNQLFPKRAELVRGRKGSTDDNLSP